MTDRSVADVCFSVGLQSVGSFTTSFTRTFGVSPTAYRTAHPPAVAHAVVPSCIVRAYGRPQGSTFREDKATRPGLASWASAHPSPRSPHEHQDRQRPAVGPRPGRGPRVLHREARLGGPLGRHAARDGRLPLADRRPRRPGGLLRRADGRPRPAGDRRPRRASRCSTSPPRASPAPCSSPPRTSAPTTSSSRPAASSSPRQPEERPYGIDAGFRDPTGNSFRLTQVNERVTTA